MRSIIFLLFMSWFFISCEKPFSKSSGPETSELLVVHKTLQAYNRYDLKAFESNFANDISIFNDHGLGRIRIVDDLQTLNVKFRYVFLEKQNHIEILNEMRIPPWIFLHQKIKTRDKTIEAVVGYKVMSGKIKDIMILGQTDFKGF